MYELEMTGERMVTNFNTSFGKFEHLHRYAFAFQLIAKKVVLDIACGEGYGTNLLANQAEQVIGVDISIKAILHASKKYTKSNIKFLVGSATKIPIEDNSIDVVVSYETIEHLTDHDLMMTEIKRVLKKGGQLLISSPEKSIYANRDSNNIYHLRELSLMELRELISRFFRNHLQLEQLISINSMIRPKDKGAFSSLTSFSGDFYSIENDFRRYDFFNLPFFNIIICSDEVIHKNQINMFSLFDCYDVYLHSLTEKDKEIQFLKNKINRFKKIWPVRLFLKVRRYLLK